MPEAETLTPEQATAAIDAKMADREFVKTYSDKYSDGHSDAQNQMAKLHALATPEDKPPESIAPSLQSASALDGDDDDDDAGESGESDSVAQAKAEAEQLLGENAEERIAGARQWLGDKGLAAVHAAGYGNDAQVIAEIAELAERDRAVDGMIGAAIGIFRDCTTSV